MFRARTEARKKKEVDYYDLRPFEFNGIGKVWSN